MKETVLFGTYTHHTSQGIYRATFDSATGTLSRPAPFFTAIGSPTYLAALAPQTLYAVDAEKDGGGIAAIDLQATPPRLHNRVLTPGPAPAHVAVDAKRQLVFASNYHTGRVDVYRILPDQRLAAASHLTHTGHGPRPEQEASHIHFAALTPDRRLAVVDLGNDTVSTYAVSATGELSDPRVLTLPAGYGPRHLVFSRTHPLAYLVGELSSQVSVLGYAAGTFTLQHTVSTLPGPWHEHNGAAAIRLSADDRFLYVSNRGHNSLAVFALGEAGTSLTRQQTITTAGAFPRDFNLDLTGRFVLAVNQNSDNATLYARDAASGLLTPLTQDIPVPEAVNVLFLPDAASQA